MNVSKTSPTHQHTHTLNSHIFHQWNKTENNSSSRSCLQQNFQIKFCSSQNFIWFITVRMTPNQVVKMVAFLWREHFHTAKGLYACEEVCVCVPTCVERFLAYSKDTWQITRFDICSCFSTASTNCFGFMPAFPIVLINWTPLDKNTEYEERLVMFLWHVFMSMNFVLLLQLEDTIWWWGPHSTV